MKPESKLRKSVLQYLKSLREISGKQIWFYVPHDAVSAGIPDIIGCLSGRFFAIELKRPKDGHLTLIQQLTLTDIGFAGGHKIVAQTVKEVSDFIRRLCNEYRYEL